MKKLKSYCGNGLSADDWDRLTGLKRVQNGRFSGSPFGLMDAPGMLPSVLFQPPSSNNPPSSLYPPATFIKLHKLPTSLRFFLAFRYTSIVCSAILSQLYFSFICSRICCCSVSDNSFSRSTYTFSLISSASPHLKYLSEGNLTSLLAGMSDTRTERP